MFLVGLHGRGIVIPSPPILAGRANRTHSKSLGGGLPVSVGMSLVRMLNQTHWNVVERLQEVADVGNCTA